MKYITYFLSAILILLAPITGLLLSVGIAIAADTCLGIYKTVKLNGWKSFDSKTFGNVIGKFVLYNLAVITFYIIDKNLLFELYKCWSSIPFLFTKCTAMVAIFVEMVSIKENIESALNINIIDLIKSALQRGKEIKTDVDDIIK